MFITRFCLFVCVNLFLYAKCSIPLEKLCVNPTCTEPISKAQGSVKYTPPAKELLGFNRGQEITITSKSKNVNDYWGAIINGRTGYVPSNLIKEVKVFHKVDDLVAVPVKTKQEDKTVSNSNSLENGTLEQIFVEKNNVEKSNVLQLTESVINLPNSLRNSDTSEKPINPDETFKIIEGTTIYGDETDEIIPSPTTDMKVTHQTVAPVNNHINKENTQERASVPSELVTINSSDRGQNLEIKGSFKIENVKENDENSTIESNDIDAEEDEEDEEDVGDDENDEENDDEEDDVGDEVNESLVKKDLFDEKEDRSFVNSAKGSQSSAANVKVEEMVESSIESVFAGIKKSASETAFNVENSVTSQISTNVNVKTEESVEQQTVETFTSPPDNLDSNKVVQPIQVDPSSWTALNDHKKKLPFSEESLNVPSRQPAEFIDNKYTAFQTIISEFNNEVHVSSESQIIPEMKSEASTPTFQVSSESVSQMTRDDFEIVTSEVTNEGYATTPQPIVTETSTIFSQFSVSADIITENTKDMEKPVLTPEAVQEQVKMTTAQLKHQKHSTDTPKQFTVPNEASVVSDVTPQSIQEKLETMTGASVTFSVISEDVKDDGLSKDIEDTITKELSNEFSPSSDDSKKHPGTLSQIIGFFSSWFPWSSKTELPNDKEINHDTVLQSILSSGKTENSNSENSKEAPTGTCQNSHLGVDCKDFVSAEEQFSSWSGWIPGKLGLNSILTQNNTLVYLIVTAVTVLLFTLGHNFIEKKEKTGPLIAKINKLEHELLVTSKECLLLKDEIQSAKEKITLYENSANDELVVSLQVELEESKKIRSELESSIEILQQELDAATEAGLDLNKMLSEVLTQKGGSECLLKSVEGLQTQLDSQQKVIDEMTTKLGVKNQENEALQTALEAANEKSENLEGQLNDIKYNLNLHLKEKEDLTRNLNSQISQLKNRINQLGEMKEKEISKLRKELEELQKKFSETSGALTVKEEEVKALKESVKHLKTKGDLKVETVFDISRVKAELAKEMKENRVLLEKLQLEETSKKKLDEQVKVLNDETQKLKKSYEEAQQKKDEAEKKLEVLSTYFKEKETQLQKELGLQEALWAQKKGDEKTVYNMMKSLQEEVESYKSQNETLKKEILDQERGLKNQIASLEQKAHENWVAARQAERKLEESKQEMAQLRNRLTLVEKNSNNVEVKGNFRSEELNGVEAASPVLHDTSSPLLFPPLPLDPNSSTLLPPGFIPPPMFMPPPIGGFIPPPPFLSGDRRPPPLGRMSSPPLNNRFSPSSSADYPFDRMPSPPLSPSGSNYRSPNKDRERYRHRTPPCRPPLHPRNWDDSNETPGFIPISSQRDSRREHEAGSNVSSEYSSSESLDKSSRHSGRI